MEVTAEHAVDEKTWNTWVSSTPDGTFYQTTYYAEAMAEMGARPLFLRATEDDHTRGILLGIVSGFGERMLEKFRLTPLAPAIRVTLPHVQSFYAPLAFDAKAETAGGLLDALTRQTQAYQVECIPPIHARHYDLSEAFRARGFRPSHYGTFLVDLSTGAEKLWEGLDKAARKAVTGCEEQGVTVSRAATEEDVREYLDLLQSFRKKSGLLMPPFYPTVGFWKKRHGSCLDIYLARQEGKLVSGMTAVYFNGIITEVAVARDLQCKAYAQDAIKWEIIQWGAQNGYRLYDVAGVNPNPQTPKEKGGYQFKAKWGGRLVEYDNYVLNRSTKRRVLIDAIKKIAGRKK